MKNYFTLKLLIISVLVAVFYSMIFTEKGFADISSGLIGHWKFDEGSGLSAADSSGVNPGTLTNGPTWVTGKIGQGINFDGINDYIELGNSSTLQFTGAMTVSAWVKPNFTDTDDDIIRRGINSDPSWELAMGGFLFPRFCIKDSNWATFCAQTASSLTAGTWYHIVGEFVPNTAVKLYINGVLKAQNTTSIPSASRNTDFSTGPDIGGVYSFFNGIVDDVRIYNRALSASDVTELYNFIGSAPDTIPPTVSLSAPIVGATLSGTAVAVSATASDNVGVAGVQFKLDGANLNAEDTISPYSISWNTTMSANGSHTLTGLARDAAGNQTTSTGVVVTVSNAAPDTTSPTTPSNLIATAISSSQVNLSWTVSTDNVGVTGYRVERCQGATCTIFTQIATPTLTPYSDTSLIASTTYRYKVRATDAAGNLSEYSIIASATTQVAPIGTALGNLSASMAVGEWRDFTMGGLDFPLVSATGPSVPSIMTYAARGLWDPTHKKIQFAGTSHTGGVSIAGAGGLITWDDATNQWTRESYTWSSENPGHVYYHLALKPTTGDLYFRSFGVPQIYLRAYGSTGQASWQSGVVADHPNSAFQVASGLQWFPELNGGQGGLVFIDAVGAAWSNAALTSWTQQSGTAISGNYHNWVAQAGGFVYFGGGELSTAMYRLSPTGTVTQMPNTPMGAGENTNPSIVVAHPNGTDLLLFQTGAGATGAIWRFNGTTWSNIGTHSIGPDYWIGTPIPEYGVVVFIVHPGGTGTPFAKVYKASN